MSGSKNKKPQFHDIVGVSDDRGHRIGQAFNGKIFTASGGLPVAIIKGDQILCAINQELIGTCAGGAILVLGVPEPVGYYSNGQITKPPPQSGEILGGYNRAGDGAGAMAAAFLLILNKKE